MTPQRSALAGLAVVLALGFALLSKGASTAQTAPVALFDTDDVQGPIVSDPVKPVLSVPLGSLPVTAGDSAPVTVGPRQNPLAAEPDQGRRGTWDRPNVPTDPFAGRGTLAGRTPGLDFSFDGIGNPTACGGCTPPDPNGDVGPNHYVQMVNATMVAIYNKSGTLLSGPFELDTLWPSGPCDDDDGDPIVAYDPLADRWLLSQFATPNHLCLAISASATPTGTYNIYTFDVGDFPDYFKVGVWPDAYYVSANEATYTAYAFDRTNMLAGTAATYQKFTGLPEPPTSSIPSRTTAFTAAQIESSCGNSTWTG
jgi:hypothetical protein